MKKIILMFTVALMALPVFGKALPHSKKMASDAVVKKAFANPSQYVFNDGGNISFGNGIYKRRVSLRGRIQACHSGNYLYAGTAQKCVSYIYDNDDEQAGCKMSKTVQLKTPMTGTRKVCASNDDDDDSCSKYTTLKFNRGPQVKVAIYRKFLMSDDDDDSLAGFLGFTYVTLPACDDY